MYKRIKELRVDNNITLAQITEILNISEAEYSRYETGEKDIPIDIIIAIADLHKTNVGYILGLTNNKTYYKKL